MDSRVGALSIRNSMKVQLSNLSWSRSNAPGTLTGIFEASLEELPKATPDGHPCKMFPFLTEQYGLTPIEADKWQPAKLRTYVLEDGLVVHTANGDRVAVTFPDKESNQDRQAFSE